MTDIKNSKFLLYIEPLKNEKSLYPSLDGWVELLKLALKFSSLGTVRISKDRPIGFDEGSRYRGVHSTDCGVKSKPHDYLLENGLITNSLCKYYLIWYRNSIPKNEWV